MEKPTGVIQKIIESLQQINALDIYSPIEKDIILHNLRAAYMIFLNVHVDKESGENRVEKLFEGVEYGEWRMENDELKIENGELKIENGELKIENEEEELVEEEPEEEYIEEEEFIEEGPEEEELVEEETDEEETELEEETEEEEFEEEEFEEEEQELAKETELAEVFVEEEQSAEDPLVTEAPLVAEQNTEPLFTEAPLVAEEQNAAEPLIVAEETPKLLQDDILEFIPDAKPQLTSLFDTTAAPKSEKKSLNDLLTEKKEDTSLGARFQQSSIPDLTKAIAINEKFTFIRELFHNSGADFSAAIQKLNECKNIDTAFVLMEEFKHQYLWDTTSSAYLTLCDLIRRRFL